MLQRFSASQKFTLALLLLGASASAVEQPLPPLSFIEPVPGQHARPDYPYVARLPGYTAYLRADQAVFLVSGSGGETTPGRESEAPGTSAPLQPLRMRLAGARMDVVARAEGVLPGHSNYIRGPVPAHWLKGIPHYRMLRFDGVYPGIDLVYTLERTGLRYDFVVGPDADPENIRLSFEGTGGAFVDDGGALHVRGDRGELVHSAPVIYEELDGRHREIAGRFARDRDGMLRFLVAERDSSRRLVIDPRVEFSTYLGGSSEDAAAAVALDGAGRVYVTGTTASVDFPTADPLQTDVAGGRDIMVARLSADGRTLEYATYIGGALDDFPQQIDVDAAGNIYVAGYTLSSDFPTENALQPDFGGGVLIPWDGFLLKLAATGDSLVYSTYLGGPDPPEPLYAYDWVRGLTVDALGNAWVTGDAGSPSFPATHALNGRGCLEDDVGQVSSLVGDGFVARFAPNGALVFSTCFGASERDSGRGIAIAADGSIYLTGYSRSDDYPVTAGAYQRVRAGAYDAHVTHLNANATAILHATFVGGSADELPQIIRVAADGSVVVSGQTAADFPTTPGAFQTDCHRSLIDADAFVFRLSADTSSLVFSTCLGGSGLDVGWGLDLDAEGHVYLGGYTSSLDFPLIDPTQAGKGAAAGVVAEVGPPSNTRALDLAGQFRELDDQFIEVLAAGSDGVDRLYEFDQLGDLASAIDLDTREDHTRAIAIIDRDGIYPIEGIVTGNDDAPNRLYPIDRSGGFLLPPRDIAPEVHQTRALVIADLHGTTDPDLVVGNYLEPMLYYPGTPDGFGHGSTPFAGSATTATISLAVGDLNADSRPDVVAGTDGQGNRVYFATASAFRPGVIIGPQTDSTAGLALGDVDGDFDLDVIAGNTGAPNRLYRNHGDGTFDGAEDLDAAPASTTAVTLVDYDYDNDFDVVTADAGGGTLYINDGTGSFMRLPFSAPTESAQAQVLEGRFVFNAPQGVGAIRQLDFDLTDSYAAVLDASGSRLLFSTYIGGAGRDSTSWGAVADSGSLYVVGGTTARDFPTVDPLQPVPGGGYGDAFVMKIVLDADRDGLLDEEDNCTEIANADQRDTNGDGFGNACDPDLNDDGIVNFIDLGLMKAAFFGTDADADLNGDGHVNFVDLATLKQFFFQPPGPSGIEPALAQSGTPIQAR